MHLFDRNTNFLGGHGIVGGHIPIAAGVGFAIKYRGGDQVCLCFFGEAAVNNGAFHEALNMAALWKLPVVYRRREQPLRHGHGARARVVGERHRGARVLVRHAERVVDGQDVIAVREADDARDRARAHGEHADAHRDAHVPLHGPLDVRRRERHVPHARRSSRST